MNLSGIYLPIITPMVEDKIDYKSYTKLIEHYISQGVSGIIPLGTTGESPTVGKNERHRLIDLTVATVNKRVPIYVGYSDNNTKCLLEGISQYEEIGIQGILSSTPHYNRPSQEGIYQHFKSLAESTNLDIILYNIPYRTGRNMENETIRRLAEIPNIVGLKDASGNMVQTTELLMKKPDNFSILTGEDIHLFSHLALGGDGGILASAHLNTKAYLKLYHTIKNNQLDEARNIWAQLGPLIPYLFKEPNPSPLKYLMMKKGLIQSDQIRLPMIPVTDEYAKVLNQFL